MNSRSGLTLVEMVLSLAILAVVAWPIVHFADATSGAIGTRSVSTDVEGRAMRAIDRVVDELRSASRADLLPPTAPPPASTTFVEYQRTLGFVAGVPQWSAPARIELQTGAGEIVDGMDNDGDGIVDEGRVVLIEGLGTGAPRATILCDGVPVSPPGEIPGNGIDDDGNGLIDEAGFCFAYTADLVTVRLTLQAVDGDGFRTTRTLERSVAIQVPGD